MCDNWHSCVARAAKQCFVGLNQLWSRSQTYQFTGQVRVVLQSLPQLFQMLHELRETCTLVQLVQQRSVALHSVVEAGHAVHIDVILPRRDGGQVHKHCQLVGALGRGETGVPGPPPC